MPTVNSFDDYLTWTDITETLSRSDKIAYLFAVLLNRKYLQRYDTLIYHKKFIPSVQTLKVLVEFFILISK